MSYLAITLLNHASIIVRTEGFSLLTGPWFSGTCFADGWGLKVVNEDALEACREIRYLWISHFHEDHLHRPTLKQLLEINPSITVLANDSFNFSMSGALKGLGVKNIVVLNERKPMSLGGVDLLRIPTTGIDNMLRIRAGGLTILNFNDCNIPEKARRALSKKIGPVDIMLLNFNHAGKLQGSFTPDQIVARQLDGFRANVESFMPRWVLPFASFHYYRAPESFELNDSLMDLPKLDCVVPWKIGQTVEFSDEPVTRGSGRVQQSPIGPLTRGRGVSESDLGTAWSTHAKRIREGFPLLWRLLPPLCVRVSDHSAQYQLDLRKGFTETTARPHIICHSAAMKRWLEHPYGTDAFMVGAHFAYASDDAVLPVRWHLLYNLLCENHLDMRWFSRMLLSRAGIRFLWNRREEIAGILTGLRLKPGEQR